MMNKQAADKFLEQILEMFPYARKEGTGYILSDDAGIFFINFNYSKMHDSYWLHAEWHLHDSFLTLDKKKSKFLAKANKKIFEPKGFGLFVRQDDEVFCKNWVHTTIQRPLTQDEFREFYAVYVTLVSMALDIIGRLSAGTH